jgi:hypothetical protein
MSPITGTCRRLQFASAKKWPYVTSPQSTFHSNRWPEPPGANFRPAPPRAGDPVNDCIPPRSSPATLPPDHPATLPFLVRRIPRLTRRLYCAPARGCIRQKSECIKKTSAVNRKSGRVKPALQSPHAERTPLTGGPGPSGSPSPPPACGPSRSGASESR